MLFLDSLTRSLVATIIVLLVCSTTFGQRRRVSQVKEQVSFGSEVAIKNPVKIPKNVLEKPIEYDDGRLKRCQSDEFSRQINIANHFAASRINLNGDSQVDVIVQAQTSCFMGAHSTTFWVFTEVEQRLSPGHDLVFSIASDFMKVSRLSTNGYRDIETASHTAVELYTTVWKFDGSKYEPRVCSIEDFRTKKVTRVKCED